MTLTASRTEHVEDSASYPGRIAVPLPWHPQVLGQQHVVTRMVVDRARAADQTIDVPEAQAGVGERRFHRLGMQFP